MTAPIAKTHLTFELPKLSYVDTSLEEQHLRKAAPRETRRGLADRLAGLVAAFRAWRERETALSELSMMSDRELMDIGLNRSDLHRVFSPDFHHEMEARTV